MEFIGTFFLVMAIALTGNPIAIGVMLMTMVYMGGHISGAHYNPAVTLAVFIRGKIKARKVPGYIISQVLGAFTAAIIAYILLSSAFVPARGIDVSFANAFIVETIFTFVLASVVLTVTTTKRFENSKIYGIAIGFALLTIAFAGGSISGGAFNPAVGFSPIMFALILGNPITSDLLVYLTAPFLGGILAAIFFLFLNPKENIRM